jgi:hypothetical protein
MITAGQFTAAVVRRLKAAHEIEVVRRAGLTPLTTSGRDVFARQLKRYLGVPLSPVMLRRLSYPANAQLYWHYPRADVEADRAEGFAGEFCIYNLAAALTKKDFSFIDFEESPDLEFLAPYRILDEHPQVGDGRMTLVRPNADSTDVELYFLNEWKLHRLGLSFEEYHWCQTVTLGYANWQLLFCADLRPAAREAVRTTFRERIRKDLNKVWPGDDLGEFFALVDRAG